ncbi:MAG: tetratricopeptide repeat protein, partial [Persicimonas sp.]
MMQINRFDCRTIRPAVLVVLALVIAWGTACSSSSAVKRDEGSQLAQGGTASVNAKEEFEKAVAVYEEKGPEGLDEAIDSLEDAVDEDPGFGKAWFNLGLLYEENGDSDDAREAYENAIESAPSLGAPHVNLGMMALDKGDRERGRKLFERALESESYNPAAHNNISVFLREEDDFPKAVRHARLSLAGDASNVTAYTNLARIYYDRGNHDVAKLVILNALKMDAGLKDPDLHNMLGLVELARNDVT